MRRTSIPLLLAALIPLCPAQDKKWGAGAFFPEEYNGEIKVDVGRLTDLGVTGQLLRSPLAFAAGMFRDHFGFSIEELERVTFAIKEFESDDDTWHMPESVWVMEGGSNVGIRGKLAEGTAPASVAGVSYVEDGSAEVCSPAPGLLIFNSEYPEGQGRIGPILRGAKKGGVPTAALLELTTKPFAIATLVRLVPPHEAERGYWFPAVDASSVVPDDLAQALALYVIENPKTEGLSIELLVRFQQGKLGADKFEATLKGLLETGKAEPAAKPFLDLLGGIEFRRDGRDLVANLALGTGRDAVGKLANFGVLLGTFGMSGGVDAAQEVQLVLEDVTAGEAEPAPASSPATEPVPEKKKKLR